MLFLILETENRKARISKGRTIREFVAGVVILPTAFSVLWFAAFGGTGIYIELFGRGGLGSVVLEDASKAIFALYSNYPFPSLLSFISIVLVTIFIITSADSASFVLGMMSTGGNINPPSKIKLFWGIILGILSAGAIFTGGGIEVMKTVGIFGAMPFIFIMLIQLGCFLKILHKTESLELKNNRDEVINNEKN